MARYKHLFLTPALVLVIAAPAQAAWTAPERVSPAKAGIPGPLSVSTARGTFPQTVFDRAGRGLAVRIVTRRRPGGRQSYGVVEYARLSTAGRLGEVVALSKMPTNVFGLSVAVNGDGHVLAAWTTRRGPGSTGRIQIAQGTTAKGIKVTGGVSGKGPASRVDVAINDRGDAVVAFVEGGRAKAAFTSNEGVFASAQDLGPAAQNAAVLDAAIGAGGHAVVAWSEFVATGETYEGPPVTTVRAANKLPLQDFGATEVLDTAATITRFGPTAAMAGDGTALVGWAHDNGAAAGSSAYAALRAPGGPPFGAPRDLSGPAGADAPAVGFTSDGTATAGWTMRGTELQAASRPQNGDWTAAQTLSSGTAVSGLRMGAGRLAFRSGNALELTRLEG